MGAQWDYVNGSVIRDEILGVPNVSKEESMFQVY